MKKLFQKITSALLAVMMTAGIIASARETNFYGDFDFPNIDYSQMAYYPYNVSDFNDRIERIRAIVTSGGDFAEISMLLDECEAEIIEAVTLYNCAVIETYKENTEENNAESASAYASVMVMSQNLESLIKDLYDSDYGDSLAEKYGRDNIEQLIDNSGTDEFYELSNAEEALVNEYYANQSDLEKCREIFIKLVDIRNNIAAEQGYSSYADYAYEVIYGRDYSSEDADMFFGYVKQYIVPVYVVLAGIVADMSGDAYASEFTPREAQELVAGGLDDISSELKESFDYMLTYHLLDMEYSDKKIMPGTGATFDLPYYKSSYVFISPFEDGENNGWNLSTLIHEFGHFNAGIRSMNSDDIIFGSESLDIAETQSQGLELLFMPYYDRMYTSEAGYERLYMVFKMLNSVVEGCIYDEWQRRVYNEDSLTADRADELLADVAGEFGLVDGQNTDKTNLWCYISHNFDSPFYYISYATSAMAALEILDKSLEDYDEAADTYMELTLNGSDGGFRSSLAECGLNDIFNEDTVIGIAAMAANEYCGFLDVKAVDWFRNPVMFVSDWLDGYDDGNFYPYNSTTREQFITALGRMCDGFFGIEAEGNCPFIDVSDEELQKYVTWAQDNDIVYGVGGNMFGGDETITREQLVTFMYRLAEYSGADTEVPDGNAGFADFSSVSDYAGEAVTWAYAEGIINGYEDGSFKPQNTVTRAETAQIMRNFSVKIY